MDETDSRNEVKLFVSYTILTFHTSVKQITVELIWRFQAGMRNIEFTN